MDITIRHEKLGMSRTHYAVFEMELTIL